MRLSKAVNAMSIACSAIAMSGSVHRADAQFLKATIRAATEEEIQEMRDNGELDDRDERAHNGGNNRELQSFPQPTDFWDIVEFEITNSCGSEEDIKEDLEAAYERYYADLLDDTLADIPGCGEDEPKNTTSFTLLFWEEALECDPYYRRNLAKYGNVFEGSSNEELLRKRRKSRGRGRRRGKCNGCNRRRMEEKTFVVDLSGKDRKLQDCTADLGAELQEVPGFGRTRVAVNVDEPATCEVGSDDCDFPSEACCGAEGCYCATPGVSECESEGCCLCNSVPFDPNFCSNVGSCDSDPCNVISGPDPCAPPTSTPTMPPSSEPSETPTPMMDICPAEDPQTTNVTVPTPNETYVLDLTTETTTDDEFSCVSGCLTLSSLTPPYNILFNLDLSGSMCDPDCTLLNAQIDSVINFVQDLVDTDALDNSNVNFALVRYNETAEFLGEFNIADPNNSSAIDPMLLSELNSLRADNDGLGRTNFKDALAKSVVYFQNASAARSNVMYFLSDGFPTAGGGFTDEVAALDALNTTRYAIGILENSSLFFLNLIDNTGGAQQILNTDELSDTLLNNSIVGEPVDFQISVNGIPEPNINVSHLESSPLGYFFGNFELDGLIPDQDFVNNITANVVMDTGVIIMNMSTEVTLMTTNYINGTL